MRLYNAEKATVQPQRLVVFVFEEKQNCKWCSQNFFLGYNSWSLTAEELRLTTWKK
jgi:hypothetical protein